MASGTYRSYREFRKPSWAPPAWLFGPVWTVLYILIAISFGAVFYQTFAGNLSWLVALPFALNLVFNFSFTWLEFGIKNMRLAAVDVLLVLATLIWAIVAVFPLVPWVAYANIPYLLWVSFATVLQLTVTYLNT
ncbi:MAG: TspO/MBR family protein [Minisyncoccia bacterium]